MAVVPEARLHEKLNVDPARATDGVLLRASARAGVRKRSGATSPTPLTTLDHPLNCVGRDAELALVQTLVHEATLGSGSFLMFAGDGGVGKSRFLAECGGLNPSALCGLVRLGPNSSSGHNLVSQLSQALRLPGRRRAATRATPVSEGIVEKSKRKTVVIFVDDVHLATVDELAILESLIHVTQGRRVAIVGCFSEGPQFRSNSIALWAERRLGLAAHIRSLRPLERTPMELLVRGLVNDALAHLSREEVGEILRIAGGNPRFAIELVRCATQQPGSPLVSESARITAAAARAAMSKDAFEIIAACSVVGDTFRDEWAIEILQMARNSIADALQAATDIGLLVEDSESPGWFSFKQEAVRKALSSHIISLKQQVLHERIVMCLGNRRDVPDHEARLAPHWDALQNHDFAAAHLSRAAAGLEAKAAYASAADLYNRALRHVEKGSEAWRSTTARLVHCYDRLGEFGSMIPLLQSMLSTLGARPDLERAGTLLESLFIAHLYNSDHTAAQAVAGDMARLGLVEKHQSALFALAVNLNYAGKRAEALRLIEQVDPDELTSEESRLQYHIATAETGALFEPLETSLATIERALAIAPLVRKVGFCCHVAAEVLMRYGDLNNARHYVRQAIDIADRSFGDLHKRMVARKVTSLDYLEGNLHAAREHLQPLLEWQGSGALNESFRAGIGVLIGMRMGDLALVDALFDPQLLVRAISRGDADSCGLLLPAFTEVMQARGMHDEVSSSIRQCISNSLVDPYAWIQITAARLGPVECFEPAARQVESLLHGAVAPVAPAHTALFNALVAHRNGRRREARAYGLEAAALYSRVGWRLWEASAQEASGNSEKASAIYRHCGASADVARLSTAPARGRVRAPFGAHLTPREFEVARLLVRRRSNNDIARALAISVRTVDHHVAAALSKLGVHSRWQLNDALLDSVASR